MYVRLKTFRGRRYAYLVEGIRADGTVRQKVVAYLGPLSEVWFGVPAKTRAKAGKRADIDWREVNLSLGAVPLSLEELADLKTKRYSRAMAERRQGYLTRGVRRRVEGKPDVLAELAALRFNDAFRKVGERRYAVR